MRNSRCLFIQMPVHQQNKLQENQEKKNKQKNKSTKKFLTRAPRRSEHHRVVK